jgi:hypothetical protein
VENLKDIIAKETAFKGSGEDIARRMLDREKELVDVHYGSRRFLASEALVLFALYYYQKDKSGATWPELCGMVPLAPSKIHGALITLEKAGLVKKSGSKRAFVWTTDPAKAMAAYKFIGMINNFMHGTTDAGSPSHLPAYLKSSDLRSYLKSVARLFLDEVVNNPDDKARIALDTASFPIPIVLEYDPAQFRMPDEFIQAIRGRYTFLPQRCYCHKCGEEWVLPERKRALHRNKHKDNPRLGGIPIRCPKCKAVAGKLWVPTKQRGKNKKAVEGERPPHRWRERPSKNAVYAPLI